LLAAVVTIAAAVYLGYWLAMKRMENPAEPRPGAPAKSAGPAKKVLYWHDPMVPQQRFDKPGKSPFMDMQLVPVYAEEGGDESGVRISPRVAQNLGVRTAEATRGTLTRKVEAAGAVAFDERAVAVVQAKVNGYVERLFARAPLDPVTRGQPLAEILAPEWVAAQEEYLALRRSPEAGEALRQAARQRLVLLGMAPETIGAVEAEGKARPRITLLSPISGVISELGAREGMTVAAGAMLFRINGLSTVWVNAEVPEAHSALVKPGAQVEATVAAYPGEKFPGRVSAVLPEVNATTRTVKARIEIANRDGRLKPGMYATVDLSRQEKSNSILVPSEAVIRTGQRDVIVVAEAIKGGERFRAVEVELGDEDGGMTEIRKGIAAGTKIVVSGQFLIDSESSLRGTQARLADASAAQTHHGEGKVEKVGKDAITLSHGPIPSMQWGSMTMDFAAPRSGVPPQVHEGSEVRFDFRQSPGGAFELTAIEPKTAAR
jgi:Cu(I)/Ag(I) efflux system membrane fusion protein